MRSAEYRVFSIALSMAVIAIAVKAQSKELPAVNRSSKQKAAEKPSREFVQLIEYIKQVGKDDDFGAEGPGKRLNFTQTFPVKYVEIPEPYGPVSWTTRECGVVYNTDDTKAPFALYIKRQAGRGEISDEHWFRVTLDGRLENAASSSARNDSSGKPVRLEIPRRSLSVADPKVKKVFSEELVYWTKDWLPKQLKKSGAKKTAAAGSKDDAGIALSPATK